MYDETIQRRARSTGIDPIRFVHPRRKDILESVQNEGMSVVLTGTAGDGKTHLCREVWRDLDLPASAWARDDPHLQETCSLSGRNTTLHVIRDLSAWVPQHGEDWEPRKAEVLTRFCASLFAPPSDEVFLIAANDGQLIESLKRLRRAADQKTDKVAQAFDTLESMLFHDRENSDGVRVRMFNLSRRGSKDLFGLALQAFIRHQGWRDCYARDSGTPFFGDRCPIRRNYELLRDPQVQRRLGQLIELCFHNGFHVPIRQILLLLANAVLGHPGVKGQLMRPEDVAGILHQGADAEASLYDNVFGRNLDNARRGTFLIFRYLDRFRIGHETSNRIDESLIYGSRDSQELQLLAQDEFYGADEGYWKARTEYIEAEDEGGKDAGRFLRRLKRLRRALFFKLPDDDKDLWELTAFRHAGEYLDKVLAVLRSKRRVHATIVGQVIRGLNRIFTGMLAEDNKELYLASGLMSSQARVSLLLQCRIRRHGRRRANSFDIVLESGVPALRVCLDGRPPRSFPLFLTRYEFLCQVAAGVLPSSFSNEYYEDVLAFKSQLLADLKRGDEEHEDADLSFDIVQLDEQGLVKPELLEVHHA